MSSNSNSCAARISRWEVLLSNVDAETIPHVAELRAELEGLLARAKQVQARQEVLRSELADTTKQRNEIDRQGESVRIRMYDMLKGTFGFKNDKIIAYGLRPPRERRKKEVTPEVKS